MKTSINGGDIVSEKFGSGTPILFIHGYPLSRQIWQPQVRALSAEATIITLDLRGHGDSFEFDGEYTMDLLASDCKRVLDDHNISSQVIICGMSMGGYITMAMYRKYPEIFKAIILTSTRAGADSAEAKASRDASIKTVSERGVIPIAEGMLPKMFSPATSSSNPALVKQIYEIMSKTSKLGVIGALQGLRDRSDSTSMLSQIHCPVLIVHGIDDQLIPLKEAELMHQQIPGSGLITIKQAGHLVNLEQPDEYNREVSRFLTVLP